jgi:phage terminase small subunit
MAEKSRQKERFLSALLTQPTIAKAAATAGISEATAGRWMKQPEFQRQYRESKRALVEHATTVIQRLATTAVETLGTIMTDRDASTSSRVAAARTILELSLRGVELDDVMTRLATMEKLVQEMRLALP